MNAKKPANQGSTQKPGVKFLDQKPTSSQQSDRNPKKISSKYKDANYCKSNSIEVFNEADRCFKLFTKNDPDARRKDTAKALIKILTSIKEAMDLMNLGTYDDKLKNYYLTFNGTIYIYDICQFLRRSVYSSLTINFLASAIASLECHLILLGVKYLEWRIKLYLELAQVYEECGSLSAAGRSIELAMKKVQDLKDLEESDPPLPDYVSKIFEKTIRLLKVQDVKYKLQSGSLPGDAYKKKIEEYFANDRKGKILAIVESLRVNSSKNCNIIQNEGKSFPWKPTALIAGFEMIKPDMEIITKSLLEANEKIERVLEFRSKTLTANEEERKEMTLKNREIDKACIKDKTWKQASENLPLEFHIELLKSAYDVGNYAIFDELAKSAVIRCKFRRLEVPYISDITIVKDMSPNPNLPNGYEKIPYDLNEADLKLELAKLRNKQEQPAKEEEKAQNKPKTTEKKPGDKGKKEAAQQDPEEGIIATEAELSKIAHEYIFILIKRSVHPEKAIFDLQVVMEDEELKPKDKAMNYVFVPIKQYTGVRETTHKVPYISYRHSKDCLKDEEEKKSLLIDLEPLPGKHPLIRPSFGFEKINVDLRQVPKEFVKLPNMDYVYLTKKIDKEFFNNERELQLLINLCDLERSYGAVKVTTVEDEKKLELDFNYDSRLLKLLIKTIKSTLEGPLGQQFYLERKDLLMQMASYVWGKYFVSPLYQIEQLHELRISKEIADEQFEQYKEILVEKGEILMEGMKNLLNILMKNERTDVILLSKITLELCKMLEIREEFTLATQMLSFCLTRMVDFRDKALSRGVESKCDKFLPHSITCSNEMIRQTVGKMKDRYIEVKNQINREIRAKEKEANNRPALNFEEAREEEYEILHACKTFLNDDNKDATYFETIDLSTKPIKELDLVINSLHCELLANYIRCELKAGKALAKKNKLKGNTIKNMEKTGDPNALIFKNEYKGIAQNIKAKMNIMSGPSSTQIKKNAMQLQNTLQNAGKIEPSKPKVETYEQTLLNAANRNPYFNAILYMMMASNKSKLPEQKYLLSKALEYISECEKTESNFLQGLVDDSIFVISTLLDDILRGPKYSHSFFPFSYLYNPQYITETIAPRKPILISKNSNSITVKLPPFTPKLLDQTPYIEPEKKVIETMSLFGTITNNTEVCASNTGLQNTGVRNELGSLLTIGELIENEHYSFAVAAFDAHQDMSNERVGDSLHNVGTYHPVPITMIYAYLGKIAYQIGDFETSYKAAEKNCLLYMEQSEISDRFLDLQENPVVVWRIKQGKLQDVSLIDLRYLTESFIIMARCTRKKNNEQEAQNKGKTLTLLTKQKNELRITNFLLLALETSFLSSDFITLKKIVFEIYNYIIPLLEMRLKSHLLFQVVLKCLLAVSEIPKQVWDDNLRLVSCKLTYELVTMGFQFNELTLNKRVIFSQLKLPLKKFYTISTVIMVPEETVASKEDKRGAAGGKNIKKPAKEALKQESKEPPAEVKMVPKLIRNVFSKNCLQGYLEECLASYSDEYGDFLQNFIENWKEQLDGLAGLLDGDVESIERIKAELGLKVDFWELCKDLPNAITRLQAGYKNTPWYLEFFCKIIRRMIETGTIDIKLISEQCNQFTFPTNSEVFQSLLSQKEMKLEAIKFDIDWHPASVALLKKERETNKTGEDKAIDLFDNYIQTDSKLMAEINKNMNTFLYENIWRTELFFLKATSKYLVRYTTVREFPESEPLVYFEISKLDKEALIQTVSEQMGSQPTVDQALVGVLGYVLKSLADSCFHAFQAKSLNQFQNNLKFLNNLLINEMLSPFMHKGTDLWTHLAFIVMMINEMLVYLRGSIGSLEGKTSNMEENKAEEEEKKEGDFPKLEDTLTKYYWFKTRKEIDMLTMANIVAYTVNTLFIEEKWNTMISLIRNFSNTTVHHYSSSILPFLIHAQTIKLAQAKSRTDSKKEELEKRIEDYKKWEAKRKKTRQTNLLPGEKPQEKIDFERDSAELQRQIELHISKEEFIKINKELAEKVLFTITQGLAKVIGSLNQMRKELLKFGKENKKIYMEELYISDENVKKKRKAHTLLGINLVKQYKNDVIEVLAKRQEKSEKFIFFQALNELGNLYFSINKFQDAEGIWNDTIDSILQRAGSLKSWRKIFNETSLISFQYGIPQCLVVFNILNKLCTIIYFSNLYLQRESILMASELAFSIFKISLPHPHILIKYGDYRLKELLKNEDVFSNREGIDPIESMLSFESVSWMLIDYNFPLKALPMLTLMDYIATEKLQNHYYSVRAKTLKSIALSQISMINEALQMLVLVVNEKNLPLNWLRESEFLRKEKGSNWFNNSNLVIQNDLPFYDDKNKEQVENIFNLELPKGFWKKYGFLNVSFFKYAKLLLLFNFHQSDVFEKQETNDNRMNVLKRIESGLRALLKTLANEEELAFLINKYEIFKNKCQTTVNPDNERLNQEKQEVVSFMTICGFDPSEHDTIFALKEESLPYYETKQLRIALMVRTRHLLSQINCSMNFYTRSYYILKYALSNLMLYSYENRLVETGEEPENPQVEVKLETDKKKPGGAAASKPDPKKLAQQAKEEEEKKLSEEKKLIELEKQAENKAIAEERRYRRTINGFWWVKLRYEMAVVLFSQRKYDECLEVISKIQEESKILKDSFFLRLTNEILARIYIRKGQLKQGNASFEAVEKEIKENSYNDHQLAVFYADFGELFFERGEFEKSYHLFEEAQRILEGYLKEVSYDLGIPNRNLKALNENILVCDELMISPENEQEILKKPEAKIKGKKDEKKVASKDDKNKKDAKKKALENEAPPPVKINPLNPLPSSDFSKENKLNFHSFDAAINNTEFKHNSYIKNLEIYVKSVMRAAQNWMILHTSEPYSENILTSLKKIESILSKNFNIPISSRLLLNFLLAKYYKKKFIEAIIEIQTTYISKYSNEKIKKYKKLADRLPFRDLARNKYLLELPNFSQKLKEEIFPLIQSSKEYLMKCLNIIKGECLLFENFFKVEEVFFELSEVCLFMREYRPRIRYNYIEINELEMKLKNLKSSGIDENFIQKNFANLEISDLLDQKNLELEAYSYLNFALQISDAKKEIHENFSSLGKLVDPNKIPPDITLDILETDYLYKKNYDLKLFDESRKKNSINSIDLITYLSRLARESKIFTFSDPKIQKTLSKLHRYLKMNLNAYSQKCVINSFDVALKAEIKTVFINDGTVICRSSYNSITKEYKFLYILGGLNKEKLLSSLSQEEVGRIIMNDEKDVLFGNIFMSADYLDKLQREAFNLKTRMTESEQRSQMAKTRDFKYHIKDFRRIIEEFGKFFYLKESTKHTKKPKGRAQSVGANNEEEDLNIDILDKYAAFVPDLTLESIQVLIELFNERGLNIMNQNYLAIFRFFHHIKYDHYKPK